MRRYPPAISLLLATVLVCPALAQTSGQGAPLPGCWVGGNWYGYNPGRMHGRQDAGQQVASVRPKAAGAALPTSASSQGVAASSQGVVATSQGVVATSYQEPVPTPVGEPVYESGEMLPAEGPGCCDEGCAMPMVAAAPRNWVRAEYLAWSTSAMPTTALVTSGTGQIASQAGVIGQAGTTILYGNEGVNGGGRSGARISLGRWLDPCQSRGVEVIYTGLGEESETFTASNQAFTILARPFFNVQTGAEDSRRIVFPGEIEGSVSVDTSTELQSFEMLVRQCASQCGPSRTDFLLGYRWAELKDVLAINESTRVLSGAAAGNSIVLNDLFDTRNVFNGGEVGVALERPFFGKWSLDLLAKIALGSMHSSARISGQTTTTNTAGTTTTAAGLLALPSNIGNFERNSFAAVTELSVGMRRHFTCRLEGNIGYTFLYLSDVGRAADQVDRELNTSQIPPDPLVGAPRPRFALHTTDFWAQGLHAGLEYSF